jgi:nitroreductase
MRDCDAPMGAHMELADIIAERRSIRAFTQEKVPRERVEEVLAAAVKAPSAINLQPWELTVVMNEERERLSRKLIKTYREKRISCSPGNTAPLPEAVSARGRASFEGMLPYLQEMGSDFNTYINEGSCNFYGAPVAIIVSIDKSFSKARYIDLGICLGYLLLAAHDRELWTCPIGLITAYEEEVKDVLNIPENKSVVVGVALGHPDWASPVNRFNSSREGLASMVRWID